MVLGVVTAVDDEEGSCDVALADGPDTVYYEGMDVRKWTEKQNSVPFQQVQVFVIGGK